ncbi:MAG: plastocyanin/azurin family copper-binding protein [Myxococcota bacterium]
MPSLRNPLSFLVLVLGIVLTAPAFAATGDIAGTIAIGVPKHKVNTIVYVKSGPAKGPTTPKTVTMDQRGMVFLPRVLPIQKGWTVEFVNSDPVGHNVFTLDGEKYDLGTWPKGQSKKYTFTKSGTYRQLCRVHDDMIGFIVVLDTQQFALSDKAGEFKLSGLPTGTYTLGVWHEKLHAADVTVEVKAGEAAKVEIPLTK